MSDHDHRDSSDNETMPAFPKTTSGDLSLLSRHLPFSSPRMRARGPSDVGVMAPLEEPLGETQNSPRYGGGIVSRSGSVSGAQTDPRMPQWAQNSNMRNSWSKKARQRDVGKTAKEKGGKGEGGGVGGLTMRQRLEVNASSHSYDLQIQLIRSWKSNMNWLDADRDHDDECEQQLSVHGMDVLTIRHGNERVLYAVYMCI